IRGADRPLSRRVGVPADRQRPRSLIRRPGDLALDLRARRDRGRCGSRLLFRADPVPRPHPGDVYGGRRWHLGRRPRARTRSWLLAGRHPQRGVGGIRQRRGSVTDPRRPAARDLGACRRRLGAPSLGLMYLSASLRQAGYTVRHIDHTFRERADVLDEIERLKPSVIGIYCMITMQDEALSLAAQVRGKALTVVGGPYPSGEPETFVDAFDLVAVGEGA